MDATDFEKWEGMLQGAQTKGQKKLIFYLHAILEGYIDGSALEFKDMDEQSVNRLQEVIAKLEGKHGGIEYGDSGIS